MAKQKILVTGSSGQVGRALCALFENDIQAEVFPLTHKDLDISSRDAVRRTVFSIEPNVIVNTAAMTNVDLCETKQDEAYAINSLGVRNLTQASRDIDAQLVHISTDYVFDGEKKSPYTEFDIPNPQSVYATSKLGADTEALNYDKSTVLRVAWVFGNELGDFFSWVLAGVKNQNISSLIGDAYCTPTYSVDVASVISHTIKNRLYGLINVANSGVTTRLEMGQIFLEKMGIDFTFGSITDASLNRPATRPLYSALSTETLKQVSGIQMRNWQDALDEHIMKFK